MDDAVYTTLVVKKEENTNVFSDGTVQTVIGISFSFNADNFEVVRTKDGAYIIREKKK